MTDPGASEIDVQALMAKIRKDVAKRRLAPRPEAQGPVVDNRPFSSEGGTNPTPAAPPSSHMGGPSVHVGDFSHLHDVPFVDAAYRAVLKRAPDRPGQEHFLGLLREGASKAEILRRLRYSPEGEAIGVKVEGLTQPGVVPAAVLEKRWISQLGDFARLDDAEFIDAAYQAALNRTPDVIGKGYYLALLRSGASKAEVLGRLKYSTEGGRTISAPIGGLARAYWVDKLGRLPVLGRGLRFFAALWTLADSDRRSRVAANDLARLRAQVDQQRRLVEQTSDDVLRDVSARVSLLASELAARSTREETALLQSAIVELRELVGAFDASKASVVEMERLHGELAASKVDRQELMSLGETLAAGIEARPTMTQFDRLTACIDKLDVALRGLRQSKADASQIDAMRAEARTTLHRGIDDVNRTFRMLLESKADQTALTATKSDLQASIESAIAGTMQAVRALDAKKVDAESLEVIRQETNAASGQRLSGLEAVLDSRIAGLAQAVRSIDAEKLTAESLGLIREELRVELRDRLNGLEATFDSRLEGVMRALGEIDSQKLDASSAETIREQYQAALRVALEGLTGSVAALAAEKVDRATVSSLLAESSRAILKQVRGSLETSHMSAVDSKPVSRASTQKKK
jgi:hypothetical protein